MCAAFFSPLKALQTGVKCARQKASADGEPVQQVPLVTCQKAKLQPLSGMDSDTAASDCQLLKYLCRVSGTSQLFHVKENGISTTLD